MRLLATNAMAFKLKWVKSKGGCQFQQEGSDQIRRQENQLSLLVFVHILLSCFVIQLMLDNGKREREKLVAKSNTLRLTPVQSGQGAHKTLGFHFNLQLLV